MPQGTMSESVAFRIMRTQAMNKSVPPEGVIGYDFFANFTLVVDSVGGKMTFIKN